MIIGLIGGTGSGKSEVAKLLEKYYHAFLINADEIGHKIIAQGTPSYQRIVDYFGNSILDSEGDIIRKRLGDIVFKNNKKLKKLNEFTHPYMFKEIEVIISNIDKSQMVVLEAAVMIEAKFFKLVDELWYIYSDEDVRLKRLVNYRNIDLEKAKNMMKHQLQDKDFRNYADYTIDNSYTLEKTLSQIEDRIKTTMKLK